jgi:hypothetical protein
VELDGGWSFVAGAGWFGGIFDSIAVVARAFDCARAGAVPPGWEEFVGDLGVDGR